MIDKQVSVAAGKTVDRDGAMPHSKNKCTEPSF